jgi:hypothetical protein
MNILMITANDPAGMGLAFTNAINRYSEHTCRLITTAEKYGFDYEKDIHIPDIEDDDFGEVEQLLKNADIFHFHVMQDENSHLGPLVIRDYIRGKKILHHHHGHPDFRAHPENYREKYSRLQRSVLVSTPDLLKLLPGATWQPNLVPINDLLLLPEPTPLNSAIVIGQSVTRKDLKNTGDLLEVISKIQKIGLRRKIHLDIIENTDYRECLRRKNRCHIIFDHMQGYYGVSSLESLSQGKPVIAGLDEWNISHIIKFAGTSFVPWIVCRSKEQLESALKLLSQNPERLEEAGQESRNFMCRHWSDKKVIQTLSSFYDTV